MPMHPACIVWESAPEHRLPRLAEALHVDVVADPVARAREVQPVLARQRLEHAVVVGVLVVELDDVVVDVLHGALDLDPRLAELLELHQRHRAGGVLEQRLVHADRDRRPGLELAVGEVLLQDLVGQVRAGIGLRSSARRASRSEATPAPARLCAGRPSRPRWRWRRTVAAARPSRARRSRNAPTGARRLSATSNATARASQAAGQRHRLGQRGRDDAVVGEAAFGPLMVLLDEAAPGDRAGRRPRSTSSSSPNRFVPPAPEAQLVVDERHARAPAYFRRNALIRTSYCWASREYTP